MRLLITRPREDAEALAGRLRDLGHETVIEPLLEIRDLAISETDMSDLLGGVQAVAVTSANGLRALARATPRRDLEISAVGEASAQAAHKAGFGQVDSADGDVTALAERIIGNRNPKDGALLHVAGSRVAGDLSGLLQEAGFEVRRAVLYEAVKATGLSPSVSESLAAGKFDGVLLFSPRTATSFVELIEQAGLADCGARMTAWCLSPAVAEKAGGIPWARIAIAAHPDQQSLIGIISA